MCCRGAKKHHKNREPKISKEKSVKRDPQWRNCVFTLNNYTDEDVTTLKELKCKYLIFGYEVAPKTGTPHLQGYVEFSSGTRLSTLKKKNAKIHWEERLGTAKEAADYCKKGGNFYEQGTISNQGERTDLRSLADEILRGKKVDEIVVENPMAFHQYGRTLIRLEDIAMKESHRTEMTTGEWIVGPTGAGKSHRAFQNYSAKTHYIWPMDEEFHDGYTQQEIVVINEFRGGIPYHKLLSLIDKWPLSLKRKGRSPIPFTSKHVIITSPLLPEEIYHNLSEKDSLAQLYRRIKVIKLDSATEVVGGNTNPDHW